MNFGAFRHSTNSTAARAAALAWLATVDGDALLAEARALPDDRLTRLTRLRRLAPSVEIAAAAVELIELRVRARAKFAGADTMFFTPEGLEQATGERIAAYRARRFPSGGSVLDACCGIGGDARQLAARGPVLAVDRDPAAALCTRLNAREAGSAAGDGSTDCGELESVAGGVRTFCADVTSLALGRLADRGVRAAFFDPSRRGAGPDGGRTRLRSAEDYAPPLSWVSALREHFSSVAVKVSPAIDDGAPKAFGARVEFLSDRGECKEAVLWFGQAGEALAVPSGAEEPYFATIVGAEGETSTLSPFLCPPLATATIGDYLYEPDPAVIRAHLIPQIAAEVEAHWIQPGVPYLTSNRHVTTPFATAFRVVEHLPYHQKEVQRRLRTLGAHLTAVKKRGVPLEPATVQKALAPCGDRALVLILMRRAERVIAVLCERI